MALKQLFYCLFLELNSRANQVAHYLRKHGVGPDALVGIYVQRSLEMMIALLGVLKSGGAYVRLDPAFPAQRLSLIVEDADVCALVTQQEIASLLQAQGLQVFYVNEPAISLESTENPASVL